MKLKQLKKMLDKLDKNQLEQELLFNDTEGCRSGIAKVIRQPHDLIYDGGDDPVALQSRKQLKENGYIQEEIEEMEVEIPKGSYVVMLNQE